MSARWIAGRATFTIVMSSSSMKVAVQTATSVHDFRSMEATYTWSHAANPRCLERRRGRAGRDQRRRARRAPRAPGVHRAPARQPADPGGRRAPRRERPRRDRRAGRARRGRPPDRRPYGRRRARHARGRPGRPLGLRRRRLAPPQQEDRAEDRHAEGVRRRDPPLDGHVRHRPGRHRQDVPRDGDGRRGAARARRGAHHPDAPRGRGRRAARLPAGRPDGEGRSVPAPALRRALRHARARQGEQPDGARHDRGRAAGIHARPHA